MGKTSYLVLWGGVNRRNERSIGGIKLVGPPCVRLSETPMLNREGNLYLIKIFNQGLHP